MDPQGPHGSANKWVLGNFCDTAAGANCADPLQTVICFKCHRYAVYYNDTVAISRFSHPTNGNMRDNTANAFGIWCMNCHGGNPEGGIHGSNLGKGASGANNISDHFMNGAHIVGMTYGTGGVAKSGSCWTLNGTSAYAIANCGTHKGGRTFDPAYDY